MTDNRFISRSCNDTEYPSASRTTSCYPGRPFPPDKSSDYRIILARFSPSLPFYPSTSEFSSQSDVRACKFRSDSVPPVLYNVTHRRDKTACVCISTPVSSSYDPRAQARVHVACLGWREISIPHLLPQLALQSLQSHLSPTNFIVSSTTSRFIDTFHRLFYFIDYKVSRQRLQSARGR